MKNQNRKYNPLVILIGMYAGFVLVRFLLALGTSAYPIVNIDEFLYYGMARSIANGEGLMFRGQQADYSYILYSLVLAPVYLLGLKGPVLYRAMQLWNILIITLSIFPIYGIAKQCIKDEKKALWLTGISMLLPEFKLGQLMMAENIIFPLFFTLFFLILCYLESENMLKILLLGLIGGFLFSAKPGSVIPAVVFFILLIITSIAKREVKQILRVSFGAIVLIAVSLFFFLLVKLLNGNSSILSIYKKQVTGVEHLEVFFRFIGVYFLYLFIACGFGCIFLIGKKYNYYLHDQKFVLCVILVSLIVTIIGVSWSVNRHEYQSSTAHIRYMGSYIPILFMYSLIPVKNLEKQKKRKKSFPVLGILCLIITALLLICIGIYSGISEKFIISENMSLSIIAQLFRNKIPPLFVSSLVIILCGIFIYLLWQNEIINLERKSAVILLIFMLINNFASYLISYDDTRFDFATEADALWRTVSEETDPLYVFTLSTVSSYYGPLDVYSPKGISFVELDDVFNHSNESQGVYKPFIPAGLRGNIPIQKTPDTNLIFMDPTAFVMLKLSNNTEHITLNENGLHLVKILNKNERWLDWIIGNTENAYLYAGNIGVLKIFDEELLLSPLTIRFKVKSDIDMPFSIFSNAEANTLQLEAGLHEYEVTFQTPLKVYNFVTEAGNLRFYSWELINE